MGPKTVCFGAFTVARHFGYPNQSYQAPKVTQMMDFMENLQWHPKTALSRRFWRFTKMVIKTVRFIFLQNPFREGFISQNEPLKIFFFENIMKRTVFMTILKLQPPVFTPGKWLFWGSLGTIFRWNPIPYWVLRHTLVKNIFDGWNFSSKSFQMTPMLHVLLNRSLRNATAKARNTRSLRVNN